MNNMLEYMTGGQCYNCGGKVRYADGGENMEGQPPMGPVAEVGQKRQPSTLDASAKQLMTFLLDQLSKGTSERILRKTLVDSGVKADQADELLGIAKQEFDKSIAEGDYSTSEQERQMEMQAREQQMAQQQQMGMMNQAGPGPSAGMDPSMMAMNQQGDQSNVADAEMQQGSYGGFFSNNNARRLKNKKNVVNIIYNVNGEPIEADEFGNPLAPDAQAMVAPEQLYNPGIRVSGDIFDGGNAYTTPKMNMGGTCPDGLVWNDTTGTCVPTATTATMMQAGAGPVNLGTGNPVQTQNAVKQGTDTINDSAIQAAKLQDKNRNAEGSYYDKLLNANQTKRQQGFNNSMAGMGAIHQQMMEGKMPWQAPAGTPAVPVANPVSELSKATQSVNTLSQMATQRFGGLARFLGGGEPSGGCPDAHYWDGTTCVPVFSSNSAKATNSDLAVGNNGVPVKGLDGSNSPIFGSDPNAIMGTDWSNNMQQTKIFEDDAPAYIRDNASNTVTQQNAYNTTGDRTAFDSNAVNNNNNNNKDAAPIDPRLTNSPYIVRTDKNKIANLDNNWVNKALAVGSNLGSAQTLGATGAFGPYLQMLLGATGAVSSAALGAKKIFAGNKSTVYDDKGNRFEYDNKRSFRNAGRDNSQNQANNGSQNASDNIADSGVNEDIPKGMMMQTNTDKYGQPVGINRQGQLASYDNPLRNHERQMGTDLDGNPIMDKYGDTDRMNDMLDITGKTKKDFRAQGPALFGENKYGSKEELQQDYQDAGFFGKMQQRNQFKRDAAWDPNLSNSDESNAFMNRVNPPAEDPAVIKEDGGEWNPFVDNRRKLRISMPMYGPGGAINNETSPYTQQEWAQVQSKTFPLKPEDIQPYNDYVASFNNTTGNQTNATAPQLNMNNNANNALSANPNANMVDTKEVTVDSGDPLGARVAQNLYSGLSGWNAGLDEINGRKRVAEIGKKRQQIGNSMEYAAVNPWNQSGSNMTNATQGSNYQVDARQQGATQDWQTTLNAKFGGSMYRKGGTYNLSPQELQAIIAMGGEVEFLD